MSQVNIYLNSPRAIITDDVAVVEISAYVENDFYLATGASRRDPRDPVNPEIGIKLALGRAVRQLGREILHDAQLGVREQDRVRKAQEAAAAAGAERKAKRAKQAKKKLKG